MWAIDDGLKLNDQVVVEGIANLKDGTAVAAQAGNNSGGRTLSHV